MAYVFLIPVVAMHLPGVGGVGAADLLTPVGFLVLILLRRVASIQVSHIALAGFMLAALASLLMIDEKRIAVDCAIRWARLASIIITFYFGLFMPISHRQLKRVMLGYSIGGLLAVLAGVLLYKLQIEIHSGQQRLWTDGGYQIRAGGLLGNTGAFGHQTATWCVTSVAALCFLSNSRFRPILAGLVLALSAYTIYIASSRAAMLHLFTGIATVTIIMRTTTFHRRQLLAYGILGVLALVLVFCCAKVIGPPELGSSEGLTANLARFVPGLGGTSLDEFSSNRAENWPEFIAMMSDHWLLGTGYKTGVRMHEESPDNSYLSVMLETGVVGFFCMAMFVTSILYRLLVLYRCGDRFAAVMLAVCVGQLTHCLTSDVYTFWLTMPVVYLFLGLVIQRSPAGTFGAISKHQSETEDPV